MNFGKPWVLPTVFLFKRPLSVYTGTKNERGRGLCRFLIPMPIMTRTALTATGMRSFPPCRGSAWGWCWTRDATCPPPVRRQSWRNRYPHVYAAVGVHPEDCDGFQDSDLTELRQLLERPKVVAIGEIGLDYYWEDNPPRAFQQTVFRKQLALAAELDLPVIVHDREAHGDCLAIIKEFPTVTGVFHCFSRLTRDGGGAAEAGLVSGLRRAHHLQKRKAGPGGGRAITPLDRMVVETDAPYMAPVPMRGKRNDSRYLPYVIEKLAEWKGVTAEEMTRVTWENGRRLFRI